MIQSEFLSQLWLDDIQEGALKQAKDIANLPVSFSHIAIMPDSHQGYGMPIGGVLASRKTRLFQMLLACDIGCGMCSLRTNQKEVDRNQLKNIMSTIRKTVPVGFSHHNDKQGESWMPERSGNLPIIEQEYQSALKQVGTLGGGNHFIEIQKGSDGCIWIMIHSGSRNIGFTTAKHYNDKAKKLNNNREDVPKDLAFFRESTEEFSHYIDEMNYCIEFALSNRTLMMERVKNAFADEISDVEFEDFINKPHNFAARENHFSRELIVHRKGATRARKGELGMIPGSQGAPSYIVRGKGNRMAFESCSHGAGRVMSRTQAKKTLSLVEQTKPLDEKKNSTCNTSPERSGRSPRIVQKH